MQPRAFVWSTSYLLRQEPISNVLCKNNPFSDPPPYTAVSYTWGEEVRDRSLQVKITLNGKPLNIRRNIYHFLQQIQEIGDERLLWIDAICIDQSNDAEKGQQVSMMGKIYESATWVYVWLGEAADDSDFVMDVANFANRYPVQEIRDLTQEWLRPNMKLDVSDFVQDFRDHLQRLMHDPRAGPRLFASLAKLLQRQYWSRIWIVQENRVAKNNVIFHCGAKQVFWSLLHTVGIQAQLFESYAYSNQRRIITSIFWRDLRPSSHLDRPDDFISLIERYRTWSSHDPRDKIYGLLGLIKGPHGRKALESDYTVDRSSVLWNTITHCEPRQGYRFTRFIDLAYLLQSTMDIPNEELLTSMSRITIPATSLGFCCRPDQRSGGIICKISFDSDQELQSSTLDHPGIAFVAATADDEKRPDEGHESRSAHTEGKNHSRDRFTHATLYLRSATHPELTVHAEVILFEKMEYSDRRSSDWRVSGNPALSTWNSNLISTDDLTFTSSLSEQGSEYFNTFTFDRPLVQTAVVLSNTRES